MSNVYRIVQWNRHKRWYDALAVTGIVGFVALFVGIGKAVKGDAVSDEVLIIRALALCAFLLLHVILCIGPLARLCTWASPLLYNRRHLGVLMCFVALAHAALATGYYGGFGGVFALRAILSAGDFRSISGFPFEWLGLCALVVLIVMAATSHDFWLKNLGAAGWKWLHMSVYGAYALLVLHVALGTMQSEPSLARTLVLLTGISLVGTLHSAAAWKELKQLRAEAAIIATEAAVDWADVCTIDEITDKRAVLVTLPGTCKEQIAVYKDGDAFHALSNVCAHQGGPLSEGKIVDGCVTCPWHGYQYIAATGASPPPFTERVPTYDVRVQGKQIQVGCKPRKARGVQ